jgi:hypothetical protein
MVTGRVFNADGTPVNTAVVTYGAMPPGQTCADEQDASPVVVAQTPVDAAGHYQFRYVHQDQCGNGFTISTQDPNTGALRQLNNFVRAAGEQLVMDIPLLGRGSVTGTIRTGAGLPQPGATVVALSATDPQVGGTAISDGLGHYSISGIIVGPVNVQAGFQGNVGRGAGNIVTAGAAAAVDVTLDTGSLNVSGTLSKKVDGGAPQPIANWPVVYALVDATHPVPGVAVAVVNIDSSGNFFFANVPEG